jgi:23S rRNA (guanosine2251-2'-O)-methyltransferase
MAETVIGRKPVLEALKAGSAIKQIVLLTGTHGTPIDEIRTLAKRLNIPLHEMNRQQFRDLAGDRMTQGVVAVLSTRHSYATVDELLAVAKKKGEQPLLLILDEIEDPHNLGALIRTAECAGVHGVIIPRHHAAPVNETVVKTSAGATAHMAIAEVTNIVNTMRELKQEGCWIAGLDGSGEKEYDAVDYRSPTAIVVGNEGKGIRRLVKEHCDFVVRIPVMGKIASLNASVAGALVMYEAVRQRRVAASSSSR